MRDPTPTTRPNEYMRRVEARREEVVRRVEDLLRQNPKHPDRDVLLGAKLDSLLALMTLRAKPLETVRAEAERILSGDPGPELGAHAAYVRMTIDLGEHRKARRKAALEARRAAPPATTRAAATTKADDPLALLNRLLAEKDKELRARSEAAGEARLRPVDAEHEAFVLRRYRRFVHAYPNSRFTPRLLGELIRAAWRQGQDEAAREYVRQLRADHPDHVETRAIEAALTRRSMLGKPLQLRLKLADGRELDLAGLKGKVVVVCFWATWSEASRRALPEIDATIEPFAGRGVRIVGVSLNRTRDRVEAFCGTHDIDWPQHIDGGQWDGPLARRFGVRRLPLVLVVDREGVLTTWEPRDLRATLEGILRAQPPPGSDKPGAG